MVVSYSQRKMSKKKGLHACTNGRRLTFSKKVCYVKSESVEEFLCIKRMGTKMGAKDAT